MMRQRQSDRVTAQATAADSCRKRLREPWFRQDEHLPTAATGHHRLSKREPYLGGQPEWVLARGLPIPLCQQGDTGSCRAGE